MGDGSGFSKMIDRLPVDNEKLIGQAVGWFVQRQDPESVEFTQYDNGYQIQVFAGGEESESAKEFWEEHVEPNLGSD